MSDFMERYREAFSAFVFYDNTPMEDGEISSIDVKKLLRNFYVVLYMRRLMYWG